jgi:hypothetical protein
MDNYDFPNTYTTLSGEGFQPSTPPSSSISPILIGVIAVIIIGVIIYVVIRFTKSSTTPASGSTTSTSGSTTSTSGSTTSTSGSTTSTSGSTTSTSKNAVCLENDESNYTWEETSKLGSEIQKEKFNFALSPGIVTNVSSLSPAQQYLVGLLKSGVSSQQTPASGSGMSCVQQGKEFPSTIYKPS